jgi:hypothetical protein
MGFLTPYRHLASLGAALVVVTVAFQPFVQQTISFPQRLTVGGNGDASSAYFGNFTAESYLVSPSKFSPTLYLKPAHSYAS